MICSGVVVRNLGLSLIVGLSCGLAQASDDYKKSSSCGSAKVVSGDSCPNVNVEFNFSGCQLNSQPEVAKKIICEGSEFKARFQKDGFRYQARFKRADDGWGGVSWSQVGAIEQYVKVLPKPTPSPAPVAKTPPEPEVPAAPVFINTERAPSAESSEGSSKFSFSGFADVRYSNYSIKDLGTTSGHPQSGFALEDGAVYGSYEGEKLSVMFDLPFRRSATGGVSSNANVVLGETKAQAYLTYKFHEMFSAQVGQFDTLYGVELNDSKDRLFGTAGIVYNATLPIVHTGMVLDFHMNGGYLKALVANPSDRGSYGAATNPDDNTEYGAALGYSNDFIRGQIGYLARPINKATGTEKGTRSLLDFILGTTYGPFSIDLEYNMVDNPNKNTLTPTINTDSEDAGQAFLALASYKFNDEFLFAVRYESLTNDPFGDSTATVDKASSIGGAFHYTMDEHIQLRTEYVATETTPVGANAVKWKDNRFNLGALVSF